MSCSVGDAVAILGDAQKLSPRARAHKSVEKDGKVTFRRINSDFVEGSKLLDPAMSQRLRRRQLPGSFGRIGLAKRPSPVGSALIFLRRLGRAQRFSVG